MHRKTKQSLLDANISVRRLFLGSWCFPAPDAWVGPDPDRRIGLGGVKISQFPNVIGIN